MEGLPSGGSHGVVRSVYSALIDGAEGSHTVERRWLVMHFPFHSFRLYVIVLHLYYRFLPHKIPQSTILVSRSIDPTLIELTWFSVLSILTGGCGCYLLVFLSAV